MSKSQKINCKNTIFYLITSLFLLFLFITLFTLPDLGMKNLSGPLLSFRKWLVNFIAAITFNRNTEEQRWILTILTSFLASLAGFLVIVWKKSLKLDEVFKNKNENKKITVWEKIKPFLFFVFLILLTVIFPGIPIQIRVLVIFTCLFLASFEINNL